MQAKHNYNNNITEHVFQMIYFSDDDYFKQVDSDYEINEREQGSEVET